MSERWRPLLTIGAAESQVGLMEGGHWVAERSDGELVPLDGIHGTPPWLLPILESSRTQFLQMLQQQATKAGFPTEVASSFPFGPLVRHGLTCGSGYWQGLALEWAEAEVPLSGKPPKR